MKTLADIVAEHGLVPLPGEGGFFRQTQKSDELVPVKLWSSGKEALRPRLTSILFAVGGEHFSALHSLELGELFRFLGGDPCELVQLTPAGELTRTTLAPGVEAYVPAGNLQGLRSLGHWSLLGAVMSPGFDYADLKVPSRAELLREYPALREEIERFTRG